MTTSVCLADCHQEESLISCPTLLYPSLPFSEYGQNSQDYMNKIRALQLLYIKEHIHLSLADFCLFLSYVQLPVLIVTLFTAKPDCLE
jgi:hypothetical protein